MNELQSALTKVPHGKPKPSTHLINIIVEVNGKSRHVQFDKTIVTGREIRDAAGAAPSDDLTRLIHGKPSGGNIGPDDTVEIKNGDHFITLPTGTVS